MKKKPDINITQTEAPGLLKRLYQAVKYTAKPEASIRYEISGINPNTWMSPLQPLVPYEPLVSGRQYDFNVGRNLYYNPRGSERFQFWQLRNLARDSECVRLAIETRQDQMDSLEWAINGKEGKNINDKDPRIAEVSRWLEKPDKIHDWAAWLRVLLEELYVTDAVTLLPRMTRGGSLYAMDLIDGSTIFPLIDENGRQPLAPDPAYQQILKGVPKMDYTSEELIYAVRKVQVNTPYGYSAVEQIAQSAQTDIERIKYQLAYFTEGSKPDQYLTAPDGMSPDQIKTYEEHLNSLLAGNAYGRRQMPIVPHGMELKQLAEPQLKNDFDEWIWRKVALAFKLAPTALIKQMNRSSSETDKERGDEEGLAPTKLWVKRLIDRIIRDYFGYSDLEFTFKDEEAEDPLIAAQVDTMLVEKGIMTINEIRNKRNLDNVKGGETPKLATAGGYVSIDQPDKPIEQPANQSNKDKPDVNQKLKKKALNIKTNLDNDISLKSIPKAENLIMNILDKNKKKVLKQLLSVFKKNKDTEEENGNMIANALELDFAGIVELQPILLEVGSETSKEMLSEIAQSSELTTEIATGGEEVFNQINQGAVDFIKERGAELVTGLEETTRKEMATLIADGLQEGFTMQQIAAKLEETYSFSKDRAKLIATHEIALANQRASLETMKYVRSTGVNVLKIWLPDELACDICIINGTDGAIGLDEFFSSGDLTAPAHPRCRCTIATRIGV